jgi:hypothetical protein
MGLFATSLFWMALPFQLVISLAGAAAGGWAYKEV